ncbi:MAG TPA: PIG-L family deacetylase, partial [Actinomycetota bacterium]|nr:PIG-L family deacetylase [Actinomycetota bacterium]
EGNRPPGIVGPDEDLAERRRAETLEAARILGAARVEFLGYRDSGMKGSPANADPASFLAADVDQAAGRLAAVVRAEAADFLAIYDETGVTGHPDHVKVHHVGRRAADLVGDRLRVVEGTLSRTQARRLIGQARQLTGRGGDDAGGGSGPSMDIDLDRFGTPDEDVTDWVDVRPFLDHKRRAMAAHASQIAETSFFLDMAPEVFAAIWGQECLISRSDPAFRYDDLLA